MAQQWQVEPVKGRCASTGLPIEEGQEFFTVLFEDGEGFRREDYGAAAWNGAPAGSYCYFKSKMPIKAQRKKLFIDDDLLVNFFLRLADETEPARVQFRFVLALLLMRKRLLRYEGSSVQGGPELWTLSMPRDQSTHRVVNPSLTPDEITGVSQQLTAILHSDIADWLTDPSPTASQTNDQ
jgi:hypothetical protein